MDSTSHVVFVVACCFLFLAYLVLVIRDWLRKWSCGTTRLASGFKKCFSAVRTWARTADVEDALSEQVAAEVERRLAKNMVDSISVACVGLAFALLLILRAVLSVHVHRIQSSAQDWVVVTSCAVNLLGKARPDWVAGRSLLFWYSFAMLFCCFYLVCGDRSFASETLWFSAALTPARVTFSVSYPKLLAVVFWNCAYLVAALFSHASSTAGGAGEISLRLMYLLEGFTFIAVVTFAAKSGASMVAEARHMVQATTLRDESSAMARLLSLMCDVVVELDGDLHFAQEVPKFAGFLCLNPANSLRGVPFQDFMPLAEDKQQLEALLLASVNDTTGSLPGVMHATLRDSSSNEISVEVFYVPFRGVSGRSQFLIGIQEEGHDGQRPLPELKHFPDTTPQQGGGAGAGNPGGPGPGRGLGLGLGPQPQPQPLGRRVILKGTPAQAGRATGAGADDEAEATSAHSGGSGSAASRGKRLLDLRFRRTTRSAQDLSVVATVLRWNIAVRDTACCPFHASLLEVRICLERLHRRRCKPRFKPDWEAQCQDCGVFAAWSGAAADDSAAARETCTQCHRQSVTRSHLRVAL